MPVRIVFSGGAMLDVKHEAGAADFAELLGTGEGPTYQGKYVYVDLTGSGQMELRTHAVWVNPAAVAWVQDVSR